MSWLDQMYLLQPIVFPVEYVGTVGISVKSFASMVAFAIGQPEDVNVNEIIFGPTAQRL